MSAPGRFMQWAQEVSQDVWLARVMLCVVNLRSHRQAATQRSVGARLGISAGAMHDVFKLLLTENMVSWPRYSRGRRKKFLLPGVVPTVRGIEHAKRAHELASEAMANGAEPPPGDVGEGDWKMGRAS